MNDKFLIVDNDFSRISGSTKFIHEELDKIIKYDLVWDEKWTKSKNYDRKILNNYDNILFIHSFLPLTEILKLKKKNIIWVPMFDSLFNLNQLNTHYWRLIKLLQIKIISFSKVVTSKCIENEIEFFEIQYFLKTSENINYNLKKFNILFWDRGELKVKNWLNHFDKKNIEKITIIKRPDPRKQPSQISDQEKIDYKIKINEIGYIEKSEYEKYLSSHNIFISPRFREGIGISYLEALSYSMFIVALNAPTMNEYLKDNNVGRCIDLKNKNIKKIDLNHILETQKYRIKYNSDNFNKYKKKMSKLKSFLFLRKNIQVLTYKSIIRIKMYQNIYNLFFLIKRVLIKIRII